MVLPTEMLTSGCLIMRRMRRRRERRERGREEERGGEEEEGRRQNEGEGREGRGAERGTKEERRQKRGRRGKGRWMRGRRRQEKRMKRGRQEEKEEEVDLYTCFDHVSMFPSFHFTISSHFSVKDIAIQNNTLLLSMSLNCCPLLYYVLLKSPILFLLVENVRVYRVTNSL